MDGQLRSVARVWFTYDTGCLLVDTQLCHGCVDMTVVGAGCSCVQSTGSGWYLGTSRYASVRPVYRKQNGATLNCSFAQWFSVHAGCCNGRMYLCAFAELQHSLCKVTWCQVHISARELLCVTEPFFVNSSPPPRTFAWIWISHLKYGMDIPHVLLCSLCSWYSIIIRSKMPLIYNTFEIWVYVAVNIKFAFGYVKLYGLENRPFTPRIGWIELIRKLVPMCTHISRGGFVYLSVAKSYT
jgi:hypothetical protein